MALLKASKPKELDSSQLKWTCNNDCFDFDSTNSVEPIDGIVGQERALKALKIGADIKSPGYNIFITGLSGTGKLTTVKKMLETLRPLKSKLHDYAYVFNFQDEDRPTLLTFPAGTGNKFKKDMGKSIRFLQEHIPQVLETEPFISRRKSLISEYGKLQNDLMTGFESKLRKDNFTLGRVEVSGVARPEIFAVVDEQPVLIGQLNELVGKKKITEKKVTEITKKYTDYQEELQHVFTQSLKFTQDFQKELSELESEAVKDLIKITIDDLIAKYKQPKTKKYLKQVADYIMQNLAMFKAKKIKTEEGEILPEELMTFQVNIVLDNSHVKEMPVVIETSPTYGNLFGSIEKYSDGNGGWYSDFTRIKAGSLLRSNDGYLVLNALDAFQEPGVWKTLKRVMLYGKLEIQDISSIYQFSPSTLKPEPIAVNTKIILIGNSYIYSMLSAYEDDFNKIFKIKADFDYEMKRSDTALMEYARVIKKLIQEEKLLEFSKDAIGKIAEYGARYAGEQDKLTTRFAYIADLVRESNFWAKDYGDKIISEYHVTQAYESARERYSLYESKVTEMIDKGTILIDTDGSRVGQINGLAVYGNGHYSFGKPTRITAAVSIGTGNIINVEREAGLSGSSHNKAMLIIGGYFREKFGKRFPLSFNASVVFEQGYGMIDGDSASVAEIAILLSTISEIPIKQSLAITGSVNQKGDIQPIGGVNEKIEGFFDICKIKGLTKKQGVIIPFQNVKDLMLKDEILEAVKNKEFHIYAVETVDKALEILTGVRAGSLTNACRYQANTIYGEVEKHLRDMYRRARPTQQASSKTNDKKEEAKGKIKKK